MGDGLGAEGTGSVGTGDYAPADYIGLTADDAAPQASDTILTGEIAAGSLARSQGAFSHTQGQASYTIAQTFTSDQEVEINKVGVFNASVDGVMVFEELLEDPANLVVGDQIAITVTITL